MASKNVKAKLMVILKAGDQVVAESDDAVLWQRVLSEMTGEPTKTLNSPKSSTDQKSSGVSDKVLDPGNTHIERLARLLKVDLSHLKGACDPVEEEPYLHLDHGSWAAWRKKTPERGPTAISAVSIAATLLALWFMELKISNVSFAQIKKVLDEINAGYTNPTRSVRNCAWLQLKGEDQVRLHPTHIDKAVSVAQAFIMDDVENS